MGRAQELEYTKGAGAFLIYAQPKCYQQEDPPIHPSFRCTNGRCGQTILLGWPHTYMVAWISFYTLQHKLYSDESSAASATSATESSMERKWANWHRPLVEFGSTYEGEGGFLPQSRSTQWWEVRWWCWFPRRKTLEHGYVVGRLCAGILYWRRPHYEE